MVVIQTGLGFASMSKIDEFGNALFLWADWETMALP